MKLLLLIPLVLGMIPVYAQTDDIQELQETIQEMQETIQDLQDIIHEQLQVIMQLAASNEEINARLDAVQNPQIEQDVPEDMEYAAQLDEWNDPEIIKQKKKIYDEMQELRPEWTELRTQIGKPTDKYYWDIHPPTLEISDELVNYEINLASIKESIENMKRWIEEDKIKDKEAEFERLQDELPNQYRSYDTIQLQEPYRVFEFQTNHLTSEDMKYFAYNLDIRNIWLHDVAAVSAKLSNLDGTVIYDDVLDAKDAVKQTVFPTPYPSLSKMTPLTSLPYGAYVLEIEYEFDGTDTDMNDVENPEKSVTGKFIKAFQHYDDSQTWEEKIKHVKLLLEYAKSN